MKRFGVQLAASGIVILLGALGVAQAQRDSRSTESTEWELPITPALTPPPPIAVGEMAPAAMASNFPAEAGVANDASSAPNSLGFGGFGLPSSSDSNASFGAATIKTVGHEEQLDAPPPPPTYESASDAATAPPNATLSLPAWSLPSGAQNAETVNENRAAQAVSQDTPSPAIALPGFGSESPQPAAVGTSDNGPASDAAAAPANAFSAPPTSDASLGDVPTAATDYASMPTIDFAAAPPNGLRGGSDMNSGNDTVDQTPPAMESEAAAMPTAPPTTQFGVVDSRSAGFGANQTSPIQQLEPEPDAIPIQAEPEARVASLPQAGLRGLTRAADPSLEEVVLAEPGDRRLEGVQSPSVVIQKRAPEEVKVGKPASFVIHVQNVGGVEALDVRVLDRVPVGMRLVDASPSPAIDGDLLTWELGALEPGGERTVTMQLVPEREGELGSVARVTFEAAASVRTISTRPDLKISQRAPEQVLIGQQLEIEIEVSNPGTGAATGVVLQEDVPEGLEHPKGRQLDNVIGTLAPGEVRRQVLRLRAVAPGPVQNHIRLIGDDGLETESSIAVEVIAPQLAIELEGPSRRFLERQAVFNVNLANVGTADATNVEVVAYLDRGFSFVGTEYQGQYDPERHAVYWSLAELPADGKGSVPLRLLPIEQGDRAIRLEATGDMNVVARHEKNVSVDTLAELTFSITDDADPIEVGSEATYEIRISNRGSRDDSDVKMQMLLPPGLELVSSEAEASTDGKGLIAFAPTASLRAGGDTVHRVRVRGVAAGTHVVKAIVTSAQATVPVTKEESTMVYSDQ